MGRQATRAASLLNFPVTTIGVKDDLEAAGSLVDALDASEKRQGVILVNVAPRQKGGTKLENNAVGFDSAKAKKRKNGSPFCYFYWGKTLVLSSLDGFTLALAQKLGIVNEVRLLNIADTSEELLAKGILSPDLRAHLLHTQFRSFDFLPRAAAWLFEGVQIPSTAHELAKGEHAPLVWLVDSFGNAKTTLLEHDIPTKPGDTIQTAFGLLTFYPYLKDVPNGEPSLIIGSSGIENKRFLEIVIQGQSAASHLAIEVGRGVFES